MPVKGIDTEKCTNCQLCISDCVASNFRLDENEHVQFNQSGCIGCGHCISICPEDAIIYRGMRDEPITFDGIQDPSSLISYETMYQFMRAKRSIRQYKKDKVPNDILEKVLDSMRYAPTGSNIRGLKCLIISDDEQKKVLSDAILNHLINGSMMPESYGERLNNKKEKGLDPIFYGAPHIIIMHSSSAADLVNSTIAITYAQLSAQTLGLGTCWIGFAYGVLIANKEIRKNLAKIPGRVHGVMVIGYPAVKYTRAAPRPRIRTKGLN